MTARWRIYRLPRGGEIIWDPHRGGPGKWLLPIHLRAMRRICAMTQSEFGAALGVSGSTVRRWENGPRDGVPGALQHGGAERFLAAYAKGGSYEIDDEA